MGSSHLTGRQRLAAVPVAVLSAAVIASAAPAQATFPGRNGDFAYGFELGYPTGDVSYENCCWRVGMIGKGGNRRRFVVAGGESPRR
jgi:hypothetical protein